MIRHRWRITATVVTGVFNFNYIQWRLHTIWILYYGSCKQKIITNINTHVRMCVYVEMMIAGKGVEDRSGSNKESFLSLFFSRNLHSPKYSYMIYEREKRRQGRERGRRRRLLQHYFQTDKKHV